MAIRFVYLRQARNDPLYEHLGGIGDSVYYHARAVASLEGGALADLPYFLGPLYHHLIASIYWVFGADPELVRRFQAGLGALSCVLLYRIGARIFSEPVGVAAGLVLALYGLHVYYTVLLLPTVLVLFLNLAVILLLVPPEGPVTPRRALAVGVAVGLAALAKSNAVLLLPAAIACLVLEARCRRSSDVALACVAVMLGMGLVLTPVVAHNSRASGEFALINTTSGRNLWKGNGPEATGTHVFLARGDKGLGLRAYLRGDVDPEAAVRESRTYTRRTLRHVLDEPVGTMQLAVRKLRLFLSSVELAIRDNYYVAREQSALLGLPLFSFALVAPLGLAGMALAWRRHPRSRALHAVFAVQLVSLIAVFVLARYRIVAAACLVLFAAQLVFGLYDALRSGRRREALSTLALVGLGALAVNLPVEGFSETRGLGLVYKKQADVLLLKGEHDVAFALYQRALASDWQEGDVLRERSQARLAMALVELENGDAGAARRRAMELQSELRERGDTRAALMATVDAFVTELESGRTPRLPQPLREWNAGHEAR